MDLTLLYLLAFGLLLLVAGYFLPFIGNRVLARGLAWMIALLAVFYASVTTSGEPALYRMIAIVLLQLLSMKVVVAVETYSGENNLSFIQWCAFALGWFGMRPVLFEKLPSRSLYYSGLAFRGLSRILAGVLLLYLSLLAESLPVKIFFASELLLLAGLSLVLHFGILNLSAACWRLLGVDVRELFRAPYKSRSLQEFWGKRWNIAFSEMTALVAYRPLKIWVGPGGAMMASFLLSGLLHEVAISFPVQSGYGLPLLYFAIHGMLMYFERTSAFVQNIVNHHVLSHCWVLGWLVLPMPLLFHPGFMDHVLKPLRAGILYLF
jgi:hypothetical protein